MAALVDQQQLVPGLRLDRVLRRGAHSVVWTVGSTADGVPWGGPQSVVVKLALDGSPEHGPMLRREARYLARLSHPNIVRLWQTGVTADGRDYLVLSAAPAGTLEDDLQRGALSLQRVIAIAHGAASALDAAHRKGIVHRDVKPGNLLLANERTVWLGDFGLCDDLWLAEQGLGAQRVAGSLLYAAPEQTGMLHREVDGRADLYALGVVLFESLTGRPPFRADAAESLLQLHATAPAPDVRRLRADVPESLAELVATLLAKDPDDRPHSAGHVLETLERIAASDTAHSVGATRAQRTREQHGSVPFGRERQVDAIRRAVSELSREHGGALFVRGEPGSGKTRVCEAALAQLRDVRVLWSRASDADGSSFAHFRALITALVAQAQEDDEDARHVREVLARHGGALSRLFPGLSGLPAPREDVSVEMATESLARTFADVATVARPCVLVFDDTDDAASSDRGVLHRLLAHTRRAPLLLLCTGQDNPFSLSEPSAVEVRLEPLDRRAVEQLLDDQLGSLPRPVELAELVLSASGGNPAALRLLLANALSLGALDTDGRAWQVDEARLRSLDVRLMSRSYVEAILGLLSEGALRTLRHAALLGRRFDPRWLEQLGHGAHDVSSAIWEGTQRRVLSAVSQGSAAFAHPAIKEALLARADEAERTHVLRAFVRAFDEGKDLERATLSALAHAHLGGLSPDTAARAVERALEAGLAELDAFAFTEARELLDAAARIVRERGLEIDYRLPRALAQLDAQAGRVDDAIDKFRLAIARCPDALERASMHLRCAELRFYNEAGHIAPMREHLELSWQALGEPLPSGPWALLTALVYLFGALAIELTGVGRGGSGSTSHARTRLRACELTGMYMFWTQRVIAALALCMRGFFYCRRMSPCREVGYTMAAIGNLLRLLGLQRRADRYFAEVFAMAEQLGDAGTAAYARYMQASGVHLGPEGPRGERLLARVLEQHGGELDISYLGQGVANLVWGAMCRGDVNRAAHLLEGVQRQVESRFGERGELPEACVYGQLDALLHQGRLDLAPAVLARIRARLSEPEKDPIGWVARWHALAFYELSRGSPDDVIDAAVAEARRSLLSPIGATWLIARTWAMTSHLRLAQYLRAPAERRAQRAALFVESARTLCRAPRSAYLAGHVHFFRAAELWMSGRAAEAEDELARAEREARRYDAPGILVEAHALRAHMLLERGHDGAARDEATCAASLADLHGLVMRAREIERAFLLARVEARTTSHPNSGSSLATSAQRERDALVEVTVAASRELEPSAQARAVLDRLIALLGAERGLIFADDQRGELARIAGRTAQHDDLPLDVSYAQSLVRRVRQTSVPLVLSGTEEGAELGSESMVAGNLRSMVCAPIHLGEQTRGVIYLDSSLARGVFTRRDLEILSAMGSQIALTQEMARAARVELQRLALEKDLQLSGAVQSLFLPHERELMLGAVAVAAAHIPVSHSGGDLWAAERTRDGRSWLLVVDATGHGVGAAMVTALFAGGFRCLIELGLDRLPDALAYLDRTVRALCRGRHAATLTALEVSADGRWVTVWSAGGAPVFVRSPSGEVETHVVRGSPLGTTPWTLGTLELELAPGARMLLVTDGLLEMSMADGRELGVRRLRKLLAEHGSRDVPAVRDALVGAVLALRGGAEPEDDLTLLVVGRP